MFREVAGSASRPIKLPPALMSAISSVYSGALSRFFPNIPQRLTPGSIRILQLHRHADTTRARTELGWRPSTIAEAVRDAYEFFAREGMIPRERLVAVPA
jgi:nucleoside-diphosphate-sugar epimerase